MNVNYINSIIRKSVTQQLSSEEERVLARWIVANKENEEYYAKVKAIYTLDELKTCDAISNDELFVRQLSEKMKRSRVKHNLIKYSAAAVVLLIAGLGGYFFGTNDEVEESTVVEVVKIQPGLVIKRNNKTVDLLTVNVNNSGYEIDQTKKEIVLKEIDTLKNEEVAISVGRGYQYRVTLPDSTKVWLNSESELRYVNFGSARREVTLEGEACFDVVKDKSRPFVVKLNNGRSVTVLGTFFSVKAYDGDDDTKVSLVEGSVNVKNGNENLLLTPNKEVVIDNYSNKARIQDFDSREIRTWIAGGVVYHNEELEDIAKDISRRYNKELIFEDTIIGKERLTVVLDSIIFDDVINYIRKAGKGLFNVEQKGGRVIFKKNK